MSNGGLLWEVPGTIIYLGAEDMGPVLPKQKLT